MFVTLIIFIYVLGLIFIFDSNKPMSRTLFYLIFRNHVSCYNIIGERCTFLISLYNIKLAKVARVLLFFLSPASKDFSPLIFLTIYIRDNGTTEYSNVSLDVTLSIRMWHRNRSHLILELENRFRPKL